MAAQPDSRQFDRLPPQSIEAERSVLGAMLVNPEDAAGKAIEILQENAADAFYVEAHQFLYEAMVELYRRNIAVDATTLTEHLSRHDRLEKAGGFAYLAELAGAVPTSANVEHYANIVLETALRRRLISACTHIVGEAYKGGEEVNTLLDRAEGDIFAIAERRQVNPIYAVKDLLEVSVEAIQRRMKESGVTGIPTGFHTLDKMLSGLQDSDMIVLAARPSVGKTALSLNIAAHVALHLGKGVLMFSLEMAKEQLSQRLLCMVGQIDIRRLSDGFLADAEFSKVHGAADKLSRAAIYIDETPGISVLELRSKARRHLSQHPFDLVIIDYLQLMTSGGRSENRQVEIAQISRAIKGLARELHVPVIALSQLSREAEKDETGMPKLAHLRESGAIEQDADVVMILYRPPAHEREGRDNLIRLNIAKQRNGPTGHLDLFFEKNIQHFGQLVKGKGSAEAAPEAAHAPDSNDDYDGYREDEEDDTPF